VTQVPLNNPTLCQSTVEGQPCGNYSTHIYKTATTTRLVCDECAYRYRAGGSTAPLLEFSLLELIPARQVLLMKLSTMERLHRKNQRLSELAVEERDLVDRIANWALISAAATIFGAAVWAPPWVIWGIFAGYVAVLTYARRWVSHQWLPPKLKEINEECGYPEREQR
jgi:hypothetical protein